MFPKKLVILFTFLCTLLAGFASNKNKQVDSIESIIDTSTNKQEKLSLYTRLGLLEENKGGRGWKPYLKRALNMFKNDSVRLAYAYLRFATRLQDYNNRIEIAKKGLEIAKNTKDTSLILKSHYTLGLNHVYNSNYSPALENLITAEKLAMQHGSTLELLTDIQIYIGLVYIYRKQFKRSLAYHKRVLKNYQNLMDTNKIAMTTTNIGYIHYELKNYQTSIEKYKVALHLYSKKNTKGGINWVHNNFGEVYLALNKYEKALQHLNKALRYRKSIKDKGGLAETCLIIGKTYFKMKEYQKALPYLSTARRYSEDVNRKEMQKDAYKFLALCYGKLGSYKEALNFNKLYTSIKDSILDTRKQKQLAEIETKYETEKKQLEIKNLKKEQKLKDAEIEKRNEQLKRENIQKIAFGGGLVLMLLLAFISFRGYRQKRKANMLISRQKVEVEHQKTKVEEKNMEITDSIIYAKRLQSAILPPKNLFKSLLPESFIVYLPKDIVSGDFYWLEKTKDKIHFAVADCTGHGVPGALVSVVCHNALQQSVNEFGLNSPAPILDKVKELVEATFEKSEEEVKDGMDIALCSHTPGTQTLEFSGAHNPLWLIKSGDNAITEIKGDKQPIGRYEIGRAFTNHKVQLNKGDSLYIFSDGYPDQFGGTKGKKFKTGRFKRFLLSIQDKDIKQQQELITEQFLKWKGEHDQLDDVCVIGVKF